LGFLTLIFRFLHDEHLLLGLPEFTIWKKGVSHFRAQDIVEHWKLDESQLATVSFGTDKI